ncbi:MAG TPA: citrate/2-methylcitrate synthase, partial [Bacteroidia bacterium]|nr:citrate/2-methylcitrate synthase [Bacteroidia bacterium]
MSQETAEIKLENKVFQLPVIIGSEGEKAIDISTLRDQTGYITLDTGFKNTGSTQSSITFLDGENGILRYRGYPIEQLAEKSSFLEVSYLLIYGELPNSSQLADFISGVTHHTLIHEDMKKFYEGFPSKAHPMGVLASMIAAMSTFYPDVYKTEGDVDL